MSIDQIVILAQVLFPVAATLSVALYRLIESRLPEPQRQKAEKIINDTVRAIQQTQSDVPGPNRKVQAEALINTLLKQQGVKASPEMVDVLIESAVYAFTKASAPSTVSDATLRLPVVGK